ncbi:MAG TPA: thiamine-phosphate kinase [Ktedonobacteraceae bacterium]|nr:thiamine-phosphate kinase [Ktedonobacteraceae bacterium]
MSLISISNEGLDEFALIARLTKGLTAWADVVLGVGDDTAILDIGGDRLLLATVDSQVEGVHFTFQGCSAEQVGRKAMAVNLSDIAAMGGEPRYALVSLVIPPHLSLNLLQQVYDGMRQEAEAFSTAIVGGNIAGAGTGELLILDVTLLGTVERGHVITRAGAHVGDTLCVTGTLGAAAAGLYVQSHTDLPYPTQAVQTARFHQCIPQPRVREGRVLSHFGPHIITAMLDISDGLSGDLTHLCQRSHVGARVEVAKIPISSTTRAIASTAKLDPLPWALHGGEDYELLFTVAPGHIEAVSHAVQSAIGTPITPIGTITEAQDGMQLVYPDGRVEPLRVHSWNHLVAGGQ